MVIQKKVLLIEKRNIDTKFRGDGMILTLLILLVIRASMRKRGSP